MCVVLSGIIFVVLIPVLEVSDTHVFNPDWPAHARLHEVWQLLSNAGLALMSVYLLRFEQFLLIAASISLIQSAGFVASVLLSDFYGGSMIHSDGSELMINGFNPAVVLMMLLSIGLIFAINFHLLHANKAK